MCTCKLLGAYCCSSKTNNAVRNPFAALVVIVLYTMSHTRVLCPSITSSHCRNKLLDILFSYPYDACFFNLL